MPNYGIPDNLDRRVWKLLDPYDFDAGNDGFEAPRTLRRLLKRVPANDAEGERNAVLEALRAGRAFLDAVSREEDDGRSGSRPRPGPASVRFGFIGVSRVIPEGGWAAGASRPGMFTTYDNNLPQVLEEIETAAGSAII